jgi:hypothetical protein
VMVGHPFDTVKGPSLLSISLSLSLSLSLPP